MEPREKESHRKIWNLSSDYFIPNLSPFGCPHPLAEHQDPVMDFPCPSQDLSQVSGSEGRWGIMQLSSLSQLPRSTDSKGIYFVPLTFPRACLALLPGRQKDLEHHFHMKPASSFYALPLPRADHSPIAQVQAPVFLLDAITSSLKAPVTDRVLLYLSCKHPSNFVVPMFAPVLFPCPLL